MHRVIDQSSPFAPYPRWAFGNALIPSGARVLDYGSGDGSFGYLLTKSRTVSYVGVDKSRDAVKNAREGVTVEHLGKSLPFADEEFDAVTMFEVLEHINDQGKVIREMWRVLRPGGLLIVSVPRKHFFSFLDLANLKFIFPRLHRVFYSLTRSVQAYEARYVQNQDGLVGDIERAKSWHQHFSDQEMHDLLEQNGFRVEETDGAGFFTHLFTFVGYVFRLGFLFPRSLWHWDSYTFHSTSLLCAARKAQLTIDIPQAASTGMPVSVPHRI